MLFRYILNAIFFLCCLGIVNGNFIGSVRSSKVASFKVMDILDKANRLEQAGKSVLHLEVGQPSTSAPKGCLELAKKLLSKDKLGYTSAFGLLSLRKRIALFYKDKYMQEDVSTDNICGMKVFIFLIEFLYF